MSANNCVLPVPNPFIQFDYNSAVSSLLSPKALLVEGCEFRNMFGSYYNLIQLPSIGANVSISTSQFHHISSCGAVIGNIEKEQIAFPLSSDYSLAVHSFMERRFQGEWNRSGDDVIPDYDPHTQSVLNLSQSSFSNLDALFADEERGLRMDFNFASYSHYIRASALLLYKTDFPLVLFNCSLQENRLGIKELLNTALNETVPSGAPYLSRSGILIESVVYLFRIRASAQLVSNYISHNGGTKGPIVIELER